MRIVVDSSALLAILLHEPERDRFIPVLLDRQPVISIATLAETYLVLLGRRGAAALDELDRQIAGYRFEIVPVRRMINRACAKRCSTSTNAAVGRRRC